MSLTAFRGRCPNCGHDHEANTFETMLGRTTPAQQVRLNEQFADYAKQKPHLYGNCIEAELREQVEKLTKERDDSISDVDTIAQHNIELQEQLAALAEQNEKMREALGRVVTTLAIPHNGGVVWALNRNDFDSCYSAHSLPNLATPVLNRIRAEGMMMAAETLDSPMDRAAAQKIIAKAYELGKSQ